MDEGSSESVEEVYPISGYDANGYAALLGVIGGALSSSDEEVRSGAKSAVLAILLFIEESFTPAPIIGSDGSA